MKKLLAAGALLLLLSLPRPSAAHPMGRFGFEAVASPPVVVYPYAVPLYAPPVYYPSPYDALVYNHALAISGHYFTPRDDDMRSYTFPGADDSSR